MKSLTVLVCVFGLGLTRPSAQNLGSSIRAGRANLRSASSRPGPALISRPLRPELFRSRGIDRAFTGPGGVVSSSGGLVSSPVVGGAQPSLPLTSGITRGPSVVTGPGVVSSPGPLAPQSGRFVSSGPPRVVNSGLNRVVSGPAKVISGPSRVVSSPGLNRPVSNPSLNRVVSSTGLNRPVSGPGLGVAKGPLVSPVPVTKVVSAGPVAPVAAVPAVAPAFVKTGPVSVAGPAFTATAHPAAHNLGPAVHHSSHGAISEPVHHNTVHNSISSAPSIVHTTEVHHGVHEGGHDEQPDPFHFEYGVHDDKYYTDFSEQRSGDEYGNIIGEYQVALPDGRIQHVTYTADGNYGGTVMEVSYTGEARHPEHSGHLIHETSGPI